MFKIAHGTSLAQNGELIMFKDDLEYMLLDLDSASDGYFKISRYFSIH